MERTKRSSLGCRWSQLPEPLMEQILSFLPLKDAVRVSILSWTWRRVWKSLHCLECDYEEYKKSSSKSFDDFKDDSPDAAEIGKRFVIFSQSKELRKKQLECIRVEEFLKSVIDLLRQKEKISRFSLHFPFHHFIDRYVEELTRLIASDNNIRELEFDFGQKYDFGCLPRTNFLSKSLCMLTLKGCYIEVPLFKGNGAKLPCLQKLSLSDCYAKKQALEEFLGGCPLLVHLELRILSGLQFNSTFCIPSLHRLKKVILYNTSRCYLEIKATNVEILRCCSTWKILVLNTIACNTLKELETAYVTDKWLQQLFPKFQLLETLNLWFWIYDCPKELRIESHSLKELELKVYCSNYPEAINIKAPNLISYSYYGDLSHHSIDVDTPCLRVASLCLLSRRNLSTQWFVNLKESLQQLGHAEVNVSMCLSNTLYDQSSFELKEWRDESSCHKIYNINHLKIEEFSLKINYLTFLDGLLWSSHPKILSIGNNCSEFIKFLCESFTGSNIRQCTNDCKFLCWWHHLKHVKIKLPNCKQSTDLEVAMEDGVLEKLSSIYHKLPVQFELEW